MSVKKLSELDAITSMASGDLIHTSQDQGGGSYLAKKITWANVVSEVTSDGGLAKLDGANQPFTGDINISKSSPTHTLTDTTASSTMVIKKENTLLKSSITSTQLPYLVGMAGAVVTTTPFKRSDTGLNGVGKFTIMGWIKPNGAGASGQTVLLGTSSSGFGYADGNINVTTSSGTGTYAQSLTSATWHHLAVTFDNSLGSNNYKMYINGALVKQGNLTGTLTGSTLVYGGLGISGGLYVTPSRGSYDEIAVYSGRVLSANDISDSYAAGLGRYLTTSGTFPTDGGSMGTNLFALYHFDEGTGNDAYDFSGNNRTITAVGGNWVTGIVPVTVTSGNYTYLQTYNSSTGNHLFDLQLGSQDGLGSGSGNVYEGIGHTFNILGTSKLTLGSLGEISHAGTLSQTGATTIISDVAATKPLIVKGAASQSGNMIEVQNSTGTALLTVTSAGGITLSANNIATDTTTGTKIGTATTQKLGFWNKAPVVQQATNAYTTNAQTSAYTGATDGEAKLADLNSLRVAYENLRASYDDLLTKLKNTGIIA